MFKKIYSSFFNCVKIDIYKNDNNEIFLIREQIGKALGYIFPNESIKKIHDIHSKRFCKDCIQSTINGIDTYLYSVNGVLKICTWSKSDIADNFMDWILDLIVEDNANDVNQEVCVTKVSEEKGYTMKQVSNILFNGEGRNRLFKFLRELKVFDYNNVPYKIFIKRGYFITKTKLVNVTVKQLEIHQTFVSESGIKFIKHLCSKYGFTV